jgi:hypothetical protein
MNNNLLELMARIRGATEMADTIIVMQGDISNRNAELLKEVAKLRRENQSLREILRRETAYLNKG